MNILSDILHGVNGNSLVLLGGCCIGILIIGGIIGFLLNFLGIGVGIIFNGVQIFLHILSGGPIAWCGCLAVLIGCGFCSLSTIAVLSVLPNCGTAQAVNLCRLFGY